MSLTDIVFPALLFPLTLTQVAPLIVHDAAGAGLTGIIRKTLGRRQACLHVAQFARWSDNNKSNTEPVNGCASKLEGFVSAQREQGRSKLNRRCRLAHTLNPRARTQHVHRQQGVSGAAAEGFSSACAA